MFHYLYKTTCLVTDNWYIGVHSTTDLFDGYLGSGTRLRRSVEKYGVDNHDRVWLEFFDSREEAFAREAEIVTEAFVEVNQPQCMNLKPGGSGGFANEENKLKYAQAGRERQRWLRENDLEWAIWDSQNRSQYVSKSFEGNARQSCVDLLVQTKQPLAVKAAQSESARAKRNATLLAIEHQQGKKNSQFGTCWVSNNVHTIKISLQLLDEYISKGYIRGRKIIAS